MSAEPAIVTEREPMTVETALGLPSLRRGAPHVVSGWNGLGQRIRWAHSGEVPNIARLLKGGELLLTTGMGIGAGAAEQRRFVEELVERRVAGLVIELGHVFPSLPPALVEAAEAGGLPLIELRREVMFVEVTEEIHVTLVHRQLDVLRRADELHRRFTELLLDGAGIPEILAVLSATIANPVLLERLGQGVLYHACYRTPDGEVLAAWDLVRDDPARETRAIVRRVPAAHAQTWGWLIGLPLDAPLDDFGRVAVERAVGLVALALSRSRQEAPLAARERGNFLADVLAGRLSPQDTAAHATALGFDHPQGPLMPVSITPSDAARQRPALGAGDWAAAWRRMREGLSARGIPALVGSHGSESDMLMVLGLPSAARRRPVLEAAVAAVRQAFALHPGTADTLVIAAGPATAGWPELPDGLRRTCETAAAARAAAARPWHDTEAADLDRLLWTLRDERRLTDFAEQRLGPLLSHDQQRSAKLLPTLEAMCAQGWRKAEAARALHLNRQSLYPRLRRIEALLGVDLERHEDRLGLELALRLRRHASVGSPGD